jgi:hypothetical protein
LESVCTTLGHDWQRSMLLDDMWNCLRLSCGVSVDLRIYLLFTFFSSTFRLNRQTQKHTVLERLSLLQKLLLLLQNLVLRNFHLF